EIVVRYSRYFYLSFFSSFLTFVRDSPASERVSAHGCPSFRTKKLLNFVCSYEFVQKRRIYRVNTIVVIHYFNRHYPLSLRFGQIKNRRCRIRMLSATRLSLSQVMFVSSIRCSQRLSREG